jgi:predicted O-linked N-acetylglucosamine transferase (SPINDLY family)
VSHPNSASETAAAVLAAAREAFQRGAHAQVTALLAEQAQGPNALELLGLAWAAQRQWDKALPCQQAVVEQLPHQLAGWINLAKTQSELGQLDAALDSLARAEAIDPAQVAVHFIRGHVQMKRRAWEEVIACMERVEQLAPDQLVPRLNRAVALHELGRWPEAKAVLEAVLARHPEHAQAWNLLGAVRHKQGDYGPAIQAYQRAAALMPQLAEPYVNAAMVFMQLRRPEETITHARQALALDPNHPIALHYLLDGHIGICDWAEVERDLAALRPLWAQGQVQGAVPWRLLALPLSGQELKRVTELSVAAKFPPARPWLADTGQRPRQRPARLRIGYFSADFHNHATSHLMAGMFEAHDKARFETMAFCLGDYAGQPDDPMRQRLRAAFDRFEVVNELTSPEIVAKARSLDIHVAVDLKGHTAESRLSIFSHRAAPVQMHHIGYPGTLGMPGAIDYLVADPVLIPPELRVDYSEKIITLPDSYQVNDRQRVIAERKPSRAELGLPEQGFVFCCFNNNYKITRDLFELWMKLLQARPGSVLWLLEDNAAAVANLRAAATAAGIDAHRLVFAQRMPPPEHLARHAQADLFLDTLYYNAHTTASDALWTGLPVLTCIGQTFASRVAASLLTACGLPELIAHSQREYLDLALALSADPARLQTLRQRLQSTRLQVPLFDTERFTRHIERAYDLAWERFARGLPPDHIVVPSVD